MSYPDGLNHSKKNICKRCYLYANQQDHDPGNCVEGFCCSMVGRWTQGHCVWIWKKKKNEKLYVRERESERERERVENCEKGGRRKNSIVNRMLRIK